MSLYEHTVIARQDLTAQQAQALIETLTQIVTDRGGAVPKNEYWGLRNLAYRIRKNRKGHYLFLNIDAAPDALTELQRLEGLNEDVLRILTVKVEALEEGPSAVLQARNSREERGGGRDRDRDGDRPRRDRDGDRPRRDRDGDDRPPRRDRDGDDRRPSAL